MRGRVSFIFIAGLASLIGLIAWRPPLALITIALVYAFSGSILTLLALRCLRRRGNPIAIHHELADLRGRVSFIFIAGLAPQGSIHLHRGSRVAGFYSSSSRVSRRLSG